MKGGLRFGYVLGHRPQPSSWGRQPPMYAHRPETCKCAPVVLASHCPVKRSPPGTGVSSAGCLQLSVTHTYGCLPPRPRGLPNPHPATRLRPRGVPGLWRLRGATEPPPQPRPPPSPPRRCARPRRQGRLRYRFMGLHDADLEIGVCDLAGQFFADTAASEEQQELPTAHGHESRSAAAVVVDVRAKWGGAVRRNVDVTAEFIVGHIRFDSIAVSPVVIYLLVHLKRTKWSGPRNRRSSRLAPARQQTRISWEPTR